MDQASPAWEQMTLQQGWGLPESSKGCLRQPCFASRGRGRTWVGECVCVTPPSWPHGATPADVALAPWPQSRQCGWQESHRGMCRAGGLGAVGMQRGVLPGLQPLPPTRAAGSPRGHIQPGEWHGRSRPHPFSAGFPGETQVPLDRVWLPLLAHSVPTPGPLPTHNEGWW